MKKKIFVSISGILFIAMMIINLSFSTNASSGGLTLSSIVRLANAEEGEGGLDPDKYTVWHIACFDRYGNPTGKESASCAHPGTKDYHDHSCE
ncbi:MAG: hypothetical protein M0R39_09450 [Prolixibacteraceae bacterium]|nr:hypothetical protein [Prolixibacteraceae bacterium]